MGVIIVMVVMVSKCPSILLIRGLTREISIVGGSGGCDEDLKGDPNVRNLARRAREVLHG